MNNRYSINYRKQLQDINSAIENLNKELNTADNKSEIEANLKMLERIRFSIMNNPEFTEERNDIISYSITQRTK